MVASSPRRINYHSTTDGDPIPSPPTSPDDPPTSEDEDAEAVPQIVLSDSENSSDEDVDVEGEADAA